MDLGLALGSDGLGLMPAFTFLFNVVLVPSTAELPSYPAIHSKLPHQTWASLSLLNGYKNARGTAIFLFLTHLSPPSALCLYAVPFASLPFPLLIYTQTILYTPRCIPTVNFIVTPYLLTLQHSSFSALLELLSPIVLPISDPLLPLVY